jgi:cell division protein FtsX
MKMTDTIVETGAARAVDAVKTYGSGETEVQALAGVTVSFPAQQSTAMMSVVVALIGIVNTLSLSILERRRELGLLRVVGMEDKDVRQMVRIESVLISALGTITGVVLGSSPDGPSSSASTACRTRASRSPSPVECSHSCWCSVSDSASSPP